MFDILRRKINNHADRLFFASEANELLNLANRSLISTAIAIKSVVDARRPMKGKIHLVDDFYHFFHRDHNAPVAIHVCI